MDQKTGRTNIKYYDELTHELFIRKMLQSYNRLNSNLKREYNPLVIDVRDFLHENNLPREFISEINDFLYFQNRGIHLDSKNIDNLVEDYKNKPAAFFEYHKTYIAEQTYNHILAAVKLLKHDNHIDSKDTEKNRKFFNNIKQMIENFSQQLIAENNLLTENEVRYFSMKNDFADFVKTKHINKAYFRSFKSQASEFTTLQEVAKEAYDFFGKMSEILQKDSSAKVQNNDVKMYMRDIEKTWKDINLQKDNFIYLCNYFGISSEKKALNKIQTRVLEDTNTKGLTDIKLAFDNLVLSLRNYLEYSVQHLAEDQRFESVIEIKKSLDFKALDKKLAQVVELKNNLHIGRF